MRKTIGLVLCLGFLLSAGCSHDADYDDDSLNIVIFENMTGHSLQLDMWEWNSGIEKEFCSLDIPVGSSNSKEVVRFIFSTGVFSTCSILFDDGKTLKYHCERDGVKNDPTSPLTPAAYTIDRTKRRCYWTFRITEDHYQKAE